MTNFWGPAAFLFQSEFPWGPSLISGGVAGLVAVLGRYGADRFFWGKLTGKVEEHERRLGKVENKTEELIEKVAYIEGAGGGA